MKLINEPGIFVFQRGVPLRGIYLLLLNDEVVYVGQAEDAHLRVQRHDYDGLKTFDAFAFTPVPEGSMNEKEAEMILRYQPVHNARVPANVEFIPGDSITKGHKREILQRRLAGCGVAPFATINVERFGNRLYRQDFYRVSEIEPHFPEIAKIRRFCPIPPKTDAL